MQVRQQQILKQLNLQGGLPTPKGIALELIKLTGRDDYSSTEVALLISTDPALSVRVIHAANALIISSVRGIVTISDAITVLGMRAIRQLVIGITMMIDHQHGPCKQFDYGHFWSSSLLTGIAIRHLALQAKFASSEELFMVGLLANIGELAMSTAYPEKFGSLTQNTARDDIAGLYQLEQQQFGFDHGELSSAILAELSFPLIFQMMARDYHREHAGEQTFDSRESKLITLLQVASLIAQISLTLPSQRDVLIQSLKQKSNQAGIEPSFLIKVADSCASDYMQWTGMLNLPSRSIPSFAELFEANESKVQKAQKSQPAQPTYERNDYKLHILLVTMDQGMHELSGMLRQTAHQIMTASSTADAMRLIDSQKTQLLIIDSQSAQAEGLVLCRDLRRHPHTPPLYIIMLLNDNTAQMLEAAFDAGADNYLLHSYTPKILDASLRAAQRVIKLQEELSIEREQMMHFSTELSESNERLHQLSLTDALTTLPNRRLAMDRLAQEWAATDRSHRPLSCMMIDVDHFKAINDTYGHQTGDEALRLIARTLRHEARSQDVVCRYGGEEFLVICPDTRLEFAAQVAQRMRNAIENLVLSLPDHPPIKMTVSIGLTEKSAAIAALDEFVKHADVNLYAAKKAGRNRIVTD